MNAAGRTDPRIGGSRHDDVLTDAVICDPDDPFTVRVRQHDDRTEVRGRRRRARGPAGLPLVLIPGLDGQDGAVGTQQDVLRVRAEHELADR